ncbi:hypothetical protein G6F36_012923 [Rhizopus arrhizus]|nr:hypothetical protein G6F36_012923 [Rhizopus arrhizus]
MIPAIGEALLHIRHLQRDLAKSLQLNNRNWEKPCQISQQSQQEFQWWRKSITMKNGLPIQSMEVSTPQITIYTDSSDSGWGVSSPMIKTFGFWNKEEQETSINVRELKAVYFALKMHAKKLENCTIRVFTDNTTALKYTTKFGGTASLQLQELAVMIQDICNKYNLKGPLRTDAFAATHNHQLKGYWGLHPDPMAEAQDAFQQRLLKKGIKPILTTIVRSVSVSAAPTVPNEEDDVRHDHHTAVLSAFDAMGESEKEQEKKLLVAELGDLDPIAIVDQEGKEYNLLANKKIINTIIELNQIPLVFSLPKKRKFVDEEESQPDQPSTSIRNIILDSYYAHYEKFNSTKNNIPESSLPHVNTRYENVEVHAINDDNAKELILGTKTMSVLFTSCSRLDLNEYPNFSQNPSFYKKKQKEDLSSIARN